MIEIIDVLPEDFVNYKIPGMHIAFPRCTFKCDLDCGLDVCQNSRLALAPRKKVDENKLVRLYLGNPISECFIFAGLEPFDTPADMYRLIDAIRSCGIEDPIVIYTGYTKEEISVSGHIEELSKYGNIIVKFGRFVPNKHHHFDEVLGVELASDNQYAEKIC